jgi:hypothetical protein
VTRTRLRLGGISIELRAARVTPAARPPSKLRAFAARSRATPDIALDLREEPPPAGAELLFESGGTWQARVHARGVLYLFRPPRGDGPPARGLLVDAGRRRGTLYLPPSRWSRTRGFAWAYPLDELLVQHHVARRGGLVLHACGVELEGRALLFAGVSGAGKSTLAALWARARRRPRGRVLSDDRLVLRPRGRGFTAWGTPWHGSGRYASPEGHALGAVFFLEQATEAVTRRLGQAEAAARLFALSFPPLWEPAGVKGVLDACARLAERVPCHLLRFPKDARALDAVYRALAEPGPRRAQGGGR